MIRDYTFPSVPALAVEPCGLDALYLYTGPAGFNRDFERLRRQLPRQRQTKEDFRPLGLPIIIHRPENPSWRKIQFVGIGSMDRKTIIETLARVTDADPMALRVYRVDLTADLFRTTTITQLRESITVRRKRKSVEYWNPDRSENVHEVQRREYGLCETLYFGSSKSKDHICIYDKAAEMKNNRKTATAMALPSAWVRFERRLTGSGVPSELDTLGALFANGAKFDPFSSVQIDHCFNVTPELIYSWKGPLNQRQNAAWALTMIRQHGRAEASRIIRAEHRKPKDLFALLETILSEMAVPMPTTAELTARYRYSFSAQLFGVEPSLAELFEPETEAITIHA